MSPNHRQAGEVTAFSGRPRIIPRSEHTISRSDISPNAVKVLYRLKNAGYQAYLVGGGVRDLLLGREPKDFDIATSAQPEQVRELFRNCRLIGRRFRLAHIRFGREIIEVATLRAGHGDGSESEGHEVDGRIIRDNVWGTIDEDVWRRDFTVNALYYNIADFSVIDYADGLEDLKKGIIRTIGDPEVRYREDPVRMLRVVRFATKLGFLIHERSASPIHELAGLLADIPPARLYEEVLKLFFCGNAVQAFEQLRHFGLFGYLFEQTEACLAEEEQGFPLTMVVRALANTDARLAEDKPVTPAFLFAALLWDPMRRMTEKFQSDGVALYEAVRLAGDTVISRQVARVSLLRRFSLMTREIWAMQFRLEQRRPKQVQRLLASPRFRAAYDFLLLRAEAGEPVAEVAQWWTDLQDSGEAEQSSMVGGLRPAGKGRRRRRGKKKGNGGPT